MRRGAAIVGSLAIAWGLPGSTSATPPTYANQSALLREILKPFPGRLISGRVGRPPPEDSQRGAWVYYTRPTSNAPRHVRGKWHGLVASGLLREISRSRGWRPVLGYRFTVRFPNGKRRMESESVLGTAFRARVLPVSDAEAERLLRQSSAGVGVRVVKVRFPRPLGRLAVEVIVETDRPREFARDAAQNVFAISDPLTRLSNPRAEGVYVEARTPDGTWVAAYGYSVRATGGTSTVNPDFE